MSCDAREAKKQNFRGSSRFPASSDDDEDEGSNATNPLLDNVDDEISDMLIDAQRPRGDLHKDPQLSPTAQDLRRPSFAGAAAAADKTADRLGAMSPTVQSKQSVLAQTHPGSSTATNTSVAAPSAGSGQQTTGSASAAVSGGATILKKQFVEMEFGDEYVGDVLRVEGNMLPHGEGTLQSPGGKHCYVGQFIRKWRDGKGKLVTERYVLWCCWKANRPDLSVSGRIDYTNGDKYCGYFDTFHDQALVSQLQAQSEAAKKAGGGGWSKFSIWVNSMQLKRERWGELVRSDGSRYFGQWERNLQNGFGCYIAANGDKYIGMFLYGKFHGPGVLFTSPTRSGVGISAAASASHSPGASSTGSGQQPGGVAPSIGGGVVYDGIWDHGNFNNLEAHVIFPCRTRLTGDWNSSIQLSDGAVFLPERNTSKKWTETFQWETLLCGYNSSAKQKDYNAAHNHRGLLRKAETKEQVEAAVMDLIRNNPSIANSMKIFRRCFFFLYGTCGNRAEIGAGMGNSKLGWCTIRNGIGGCIHRGKGKKIVASDIRDALCDIFSFIMSLRRWISELVGDKLQAKIEEYDCETYMARQLLDLILVDVHSVLLNLYAQVYRKQQQAIDLAMRPLNKITLDDMGVSFGRQHTQEKLFEPFADSIHSLQGFAKTSSLSGKLEALRSWSADIDLSTRMAQVQLKDENLSLLRSFVKERTGGATRQESSSPAPQSPKTDAEETPPTMPADLNSMPTRQRFQGGSFFETRLESEECDLAKSEPGPTVATPKNSSLRLGAATFSTPPSSGRFRLPAAAGSPMPNGMSSFATKNLLTQAFNVESGSTDDLLPIHQYVTIKAQLPNLYAHTKLLVDFSADDTFVDPTSQDSFCITTLNACVSTLAGLAIDVRDAAQVVTPVSVFEKRIEDAIISVANELNRTKKQQMSGMEASPSPDRLFIAQPAATAMPYFEEEDPGVAIAIWVAMVLDGISLWEGDKMPSERTLSTFKFISRPRSHEQRTRNEAVASVMPHVAKVLLTVGVALIDPLKETLTHQIKSTHGVKRKELLTNVLEPVTVEEMQKLEIEFTTIPHPPFVYAAVAEAIIQQRFAC